MMKAIIFVMLVIALALTLIAGVVFGLGDKTVFVPPPEAVVEDFVRKLETGRYERAVESLSDDLKMKVQPGILKEMAERLRHRVGEIIDVRGERGWIQGDQAEASAALKTELMGELSIKFLLKREAGVWSINDLRSIEAPGA